MAKKKNDQVELLLKELGKKQLADFIRKECAEDKELCDRFIALGAGTLYRPNPDAYTARVTSLIDKYSNRYGYVDYSSTFDLNRAVQKILDEAKEAMDKQQWELAIAILSGVTAAGDDIINCGDDSAGELGAILEECFYIWRNLCDNKDLPSKIRDEFFEYAMFRFNENDLKGWDWWWNWLEFAIDLADTEQKRNHVFAALDRIVQDGSDQYGEYDVKNAHRYKYKLMSEYGTPEEQLAYLKENVAIPDFRQRLLQMAWDKGDYKEVLRLAKEGEEHDAKYLGLVCDWRKWEYRAYCELGLTDEILRLARYFFFRGGRMGDKETSSDAMYAKMHELVAAKDWRSFIESLILEAQDRKEWGSLLYIYTQEQMWDRYMEYLQENPKMQYIDEAPDEVKKLYKSKIINLYTKQVVAFFKWASDRHAYREGVGHLRNLIKYGGKAEADKIIDGLKVLKPRRPALLDELSKL